MSKVFTWFQLGAFVGATVNVGFEIYMNKTWKLLPSSKKTAFTVSLVASIILSIAVFFED